ncbi:MAG TPA: ribulose-phosphate 3-epimerase, partial [Deltaproteobacteria bacterium]|nr:ribulose-phosphate 3-epimerase [Deltaproteobacteria bacterium]
NRTIQLIKELGVKPGVVLNPATPLSAIEWVLEYIDFVLIMSVNPGFGGQAFIRNSIDKIKALSNMINGKGLSTLIEVDGGVNKDTIADISRAGADVFVAGSAIFGSRDYKETIKLLKEIA